jgi:LacI family transcriptional regulator
MKITIVDIAKKLKVDPSTVSLALRNSPKISAKTTALVKQTAERMGYRVNPYVSALMSAQRQGKMPKSPPTIAFITSSVSANAWQKKNITKEFYAGCNDVAQSLGLRLEHFWIGASDMSATRLNEILYNRRIQGAVLLPTGRFRDKFNHTWKDIAAVSYGIYDLTPEVDRVRADHYGNLEKTLSQLVGQGFKRIGFAMDTPYPYDNNNRWLAAYLMYSQNLASKAAHLLPFLEAEPNAALFKQWYLTQQPDVIVCVHAPQVIGWLKQANVEVPQDLSLAALGNLSDTPAISGIIENALTCGKLAMEILIDRIHQNQFGPPESPRCFTVRGWWNEGTTLRPKKT